MTTAIRNELVKISKQHGVKLKISRWSKTKPGAHWNSDYITIYSRDDLGRAWYLSAMFHELGHEYCYQNKKWTKYHNHDYNDNYLRRMALKIERYVDKQVQLALKKYDPTIKFKASYSTKFGVNYLKERYNIN